MGNCRSGCRDSTPLSCDSAPLSGPSSGCSALYGAGGWAAGEVGDVGWPHARDARGGGAVDGKRSRLAKDNQAAPNGSVVLPLHVHALRSATVPPGAAAARTQTHPGPDTSLHCSCLAYSSWAPWPHPPFLLPSCPLLPLLPHPPHTSRGFRSTCRPSTSSEEGSARSASTSGVATRPSRKDTCSSLGLRTSTLALVAKLVRASGPDSATCGGCGRVGWAGPDAREEGGRNGGLREYVCPSTAGGNAR